MGMFDYVICEKSLLPGTPPAFVEAHGHQFQSKDLECSLAVYQIDNGKLKYSDGQPLASTFTLELYDSNVVGSYGGYLFTRNGEPAESVTYSAKFVDGALQSIVELERDYKNALPIAAMRKQAGAKAEIDIDLSEPALGAKLFLQWGGQYPVTLAVKTHRQWAVTTDDGNIEILHPHDLGNLLFHSQADAERMREAERAKQNREFEYYDSLLSKQA